MVRPLLKSVGRQRATVIAEPRVNPPVAAGPVFVRFREEDRLLLDARAEARGMRPATYVSVLTRSHLRHITPLPKDEFLALKRTIGELASLAGTSTRSRGR